MITDSKFFSVCIVRCSRRGLDISLLLHCKNWSSCVSHWTQQTPDSRFLEVAHRCYTGAVSTDSGSSYFTKQPFLCQTTDKCWGRWVPDADPNFSTSRHCKHLRHGHLICHLAVTPCFQKINGSIHKNAPPMLFRSLKFGCTCDMATSSSTQP